MPPCRFAVQSRARCAEVSGDRPLADGRGGPLRADNEQVRQGFAVSRLIGLLTTATVPPSVRAAAFRAPAGMPVVRSEGPVADGLGRRGRRSRSTPRTRAGRTAAG